MDIFFDTTTLLNVPLRDGIRRVSRMWLDGLVQLDPLLHKIRVHPIMFEGNNLLHNYELFKGSNANGFGHPIHSKIVIPDLGSKLLIPAYDTFRPERNIDFSQIACNVQITSVIYDLLPISNPEWFPIDEVESIKFEKSILKQLFYSTKVIVNSSQVKAAVLDFAANSHLDFSEEDVRVIPLPSFNTLNNEVHQVNLPNDSFSTNRFLMVGTIEPRKGHGEVIDAFITAKPDSPELKLTIVGRLGWGVDEVVKKIKLCKDLYPQDFSWLSNVSDPELIQTYSDSDAVIVASKGEGFGLPVVESLANGKATFIRGISVLEEVSKGHAVTFGSQKDYESILHLFKDSEKAIKMAKQKAFGFTPNRLEDNLSDILNFMRL